MKTHIARDVGAARRAKRPNPAAPGTAGRAQAAADRVRARTVLRAPLDWRVPATTSLPASTNLAIRRCFGEPLASEASQIYKIKPLRCVSVPRCWRPPIPRTQVRCTALSGTSVIETPASSIGDSAGLHCHRNALCTAAPVGSADANDWTLLDPLPTLASPLERLRHFSLDDVNDGAL
jgi:hypothetical protein